MQHIFSENTFSLYQLCNYASFSVVDSLMGQMAKNLPAMQETWVWSLGWGDSQEKGRATHSNTLAWRIPWTEEPDFSYSNIQVNNSVNFSWFSSWALSLLNVFSFEKSASLHACALPKLYLLLKFFFYIYISRRFFKCCMIVPSRLGKHNES